MEYAFKVSFATVDGEEFLFVEVLDDVFSCFRSDFRDAGLEIGVGLCLFAELFVFVFEGFESAFVDSCEFFCHHFLISILMIKVAADCGGMRGVTEPCELDGAEDCDAE